MATSPSLGLRRSVPRVARQPARRSSCWRQWASTDRSEPSGVRVLLRHLCLGEFGCTYWPINRGHGLGRLACQPVVLTPRRLLGFPFDFSDPPLPAIALGLC